MRANSQTILLLLYYPQSTTPLFLSESGLSRGLPTLTKTGLRSLLHGLSKQGMINKRLLGESPRYTLTNLGRARCEALFPALLSPTVNIHVLIFLKAPKADKGFHYLRKKCLRAKAINVSRGVYLFPAGTPSDLTYEIKKIYGNSVMLLKVAEIESGFDWNTINESLELWDIVNVYSGISREITQLLIKYDLHNSLSNGDKKHVAKLITRLLINIRADTGLNHSAIPEKEKPLSLLSQIQHLLQL